jgi:cyclohexa-1,5-dienecarbonyl-CoA hydratase
MSDETRVDEQIGPPAPPKPEEFKFIRCRREDAVARLTLHRPEHNLLNERMLVELAAGIEWLGDQAEVKLIILDSAGQTFSGGIELGEYSPQRVFQMVDAFYGAFAAMLQTSKPLLAIVNGSAFGGGAELAALCDLVVATPRARFAQTEIKFGTFPPLAAVILPYIVGPRLALELVLTGETITAERAKELGLVNRLVPEGQLEKTVNELVAQVTAQSGAVLQMAKKAIFSSIGLPLREGMRHSMNLFLNELCQLEDPQEGLRAVLEKRPPHWKNR